MKLFRKILTRDYERDIRRQMELFDSAPFTFLLLASFIIGITILVILNPITP